MGDFLYNFFHERQTVDVKDNGEADVLCPFEHEKGFETRPSAHINLDKQVFHCKTCSAEGRFQDGGLSEAGFVSEYYHITYAQALRHLKGLQPSGAAADVDAATYMEKAPSNLFINPEMLQYFHERGITDKTLKDHYIGYNGGAALYPVFVNGELLDIVQHFPHGSPRYKVGQGSSCLLFPYDNWDREQPTLLCAGLNDTLIARQFGFNALTTTMGEGSFPEIFLPYFAGKSVYVCYDCDKAGQNGSLKVAYTLSSAGAMVRLVNLGLSGTKDDKDLTDFFNKHMHTAQDLCTLMEQSIPFSEEMRISAKNMHYPLVNLWDIHHPRYSNKKISSRVMVMGRVQTQFGSSLEAPSAIEARCDAPEADNDICKNCKLNKKSIWWTLDDSNLKDLLKMIEVDEEKQNEAIRKLIKRPKKCPKPWQNVKHIREKQFVQRVIFAPDVETEDELTGYRMVEQQAYVLGNALEDGHKYRVYFKRYPHPKTQAIVAVVDEVEESDNAINSFQLNDETIQQLKQFQGNPDEVMQKRFEDAKQVIGTFAPQQVVEATNIMYHSVLDFKYAGKLMKGHPEGLVIGPSRTGKSETAKKLLQFYQVGTHTDLKSASTAGLLGGADKNSNGAHTIRWGLIPRNHKGMVIGDELSGMPREVMASLTALRSERTARVTKIVGGAAPAKTRLLWLSNPRVGSNGKSRNIALYPTGVDIVLDLVGSDEDIARFDFTIILPNIETYISPLTQDELKDLDSTAYRNLIYWAWSRTPEQIQFAPNVEKYIWQVAQELNERFDTDVKFFGAEAHKKLARIAVSVAAMCFSCGVTPDILMVTKSHVDWAADFLRRCYDNDVFRLTDYVEQQKTTMTTNEEVNNAFADLVKSQSLLMKTLHNHAEINMNQLQIITGLDRNDFSEVISKLVRFGLVTTSPGGIMATLRFKKALNAYRNHHDDFGVISITEKERGFFTV